MSTRYSRESRAAARRRRSLSFRPPRRPGVAQQPRIAAITAGLAGARRAGAARAAVAKQQTAAVAAIGPRYRASSFAQLVAGSRTANTVA
jgi:hypothetical protein